MPNVETYTVSIHDLPVAGGSADRALIGTVVPDTSNRRRPPLDLGRVLMLGGMTYIAEEFLDSDRARATIRYAREPGFDLAERYGNPLACTLDCERQG